MTSLLRQQQTLLQALWVQAAQLPDWSATPAGEANTSAVAQDLTTLLAAPWERGLQAYRTNARALAERALQAAYPVLTELMGHDSFALMANHFWLRHPPESGDLACWGATLPDFVALDPSLAEWPDLVDVAHVEWALHRAASAPDASAQPASFALLGQHAPETLTLRLPPATTLHTSNGPVVSLITAHLHHTPTLDEVAAKLQARQGETALVWRQGLRPCVTTCTPAETALLRTLLNGESLLTALDAALAVEAGLDFTAWLNSAVMRGQVLGAELLTA